MSVKLTKAQGERLWFLRRWEQYGWSINLRSEKKWERHLAALIKQGLLEASGEGRDAMYRITEAGRLALKDSSHER